MCVIYLTDITARELVGEALKEQPLVLACKLVCCMNLNITLLTQCSLISTADHHSWCLLTSITLDLHLSSQSLPPFSSCFKAASDLVMNCVKLQRGDPENGGNWLSKRDEGEDKLANMFQLFVVIVILCIFWGCEKRTCGCGWLLELVDTRNRLFSPIRQLSILAALSQSLRRIKQS